MAIMNLNYYKRSNVPMEYWNRIADFLSCCDAEEHGLESESYDYFRYGESKVVFQYLLEKLEIPRIFRKSICDELRCPECNKKIALNSFISINYSYHGQREVEKMVEFIQRETARKIKKFYIFIRKHPKRAVKHKIGLQLKSEIEKIQLTNISNQIWYRARNFIFDNNEIVFNKEDMLPPPSSMAKEGRYNYKGERVLYVGDKQLTCVAEINNGNIEKKCCMQKYRITSERIIDLSDYISISSINKMPLFIDGLLFNESILKHNYKRSEIHPEYAITHFIADLCKERNIDGIIYPSAVLKNSNGKNRKNLVLFNWENNYQFEGDPYVFDGNANIMKIEMKNPRTGEIIEPVIQFIIDN